MTVDDEGKLTVVCIMARDWTMFAEQIQLNDVDDLEILEVIVAGLLVREDDEYVCIAQQVFNEQIPNVRFTVMIPKNCIIERHDLKIGGETKKAPKKKKRSRK